MSSRLGPFWIILAVFLIVSGARLSGQGTSASTNATAIGNGGGQSQATSNTFQYEDNVTITRGRHIMKTEFELLRYQQNRYEGSRNDDGAFDFNGSYTQQIGVNNTGSGVGTFSQDDYAVRRPLPRP